VECLDPRTWHGAEALFDVHFRLTWQKRAKLQTFLMGAAMQKSAGRFATTPRADTKYPACFAAFAWLEAPTAVH
jgi:hypothetical protein